MLIRYEQALAGLLAEASLLPAEHCSSHEGVGRVLAQDVQSPINLPSFDHAAMDGYALSSTGSLDAGSEHRITGEQAAGDATTGEVEAACSIMTGARIPPGLDTVVALERTQAVETGSNGIVRRMRLRDEAHAGQNIRCIGEDVAEGTHMLDAGTRLQAQHVMLLAAGGISELKVVRRPRVLVIGTGKELVTNPRQPLLDGQIYSSNIPYLTTALISAGAEVVASEVIEDAAAAYIDAVHKAMQIGVDLVISTGAVSMGRHDFVPDALGRLDASVLFHRVAMRPGKPLLAARLPAGPLVLALPGTPMAVAAYMRFIVTPVLRAMQGQPAEPALRAVLDTPQESKPELRQFLRAGFHLDDDARLHARVLPGQEPFRIAPFAAADGWVILEEDAGDHPAGSMVGVMPLSPAGDYTIHPSSMG